MSQMSLPTDLPSPQEPATPPPTRPDQARLRRPVRNQVEMIARDLDSLVAEEHPVRAIWELLEGLDLSGSGVIVGVAVVNQGNDAGQAPPMEDQLAQRTGRHPEAYLVDGGYAQREAITTLTERQITVYAPVRPPRTTTSGRERSSPRHDDSPAVVAWRQRMETEDAQRLYRLRGATAEWANAQVRGHGLVPFTVRGLDKVLSVALLVVIAHNLLRWLAFMT